MESVIVKFSLGVVILALLALIVQGDFFSSSPFVIAGQILGLALTLSARAAFGNNELKVVANPGSGQLVRRGPYRFIRHPMYAGALLLILSSVAGHFSFLNAAIALIVVIVVVWRIAIEERLLRLRYPDYEEYARGTTRMIPFIY